MQLVVRTGAMNPRRRQLKTDGSDRRCQRTNDKQQSSWILKNSIFDEFPCAVSRDLSLCKKGRLVSVSPLNHGVEKRDIVQVRFCKRGKISDMRGAISAYTKIYAVIFIHNGLNKAGNRVPHIPP